MRRVAPLALLLLALAVGPADADGGDGSRRRRSGRARSCASSTATRSGSGSTAAASGCATSASTRRSRWSPTRRSSATPSGPPPRRGARRGPARAPGRRRRGRDRYGRLLAYVYREPDDAFVNARSSATATPGPSRSPRTSRTPPSSPRLARTARKAGRGLWRAHSTEQPAHLPPMASTKSKQSLAAFERALVEEAEEDRLRRERIYREAEQRLDALPARSCPQARLAALRPARARAAGDGRACRGGDVRDARRGDGVSDRVERRCSSRSWRRARGRLLRRTALDGWLLRHTPALTRRRSNSALPLEGSRRALTPLLVEGVPRTPRRGARSCRSRPPSATRRSRPRPRAPWLPSSKGATDVLVAAVDVGARRGNPAWGGRDPRPRADAHWVAAWAACEGRADAPARTLERGARRASSRPSAYALASEGAGVGLAVCERGWAGLFSIASGADARRRGVAQAMSCTRSRLLGGAARRPAHLPAGRARQRACARPLRARGLHPLTQLSLPAWRLG